MLLPIPTLVFSYSVGIVQLNQSRSHDAGQRPNGLATIRDVAQRKREMFEHVADVLESLGDGGLADRFWSLARELVEPENAR
jgi:hypothetical protein